MKGGEGVISTIMPRVWHMKEHKGLDGWNRGWNTMLQGKWTLCCIVNKYIKKKSSIIPIKIFTVLIFLLGNASN